MTLVQTPQEIFADARAVHASALELLSAGDIRRRRRGALRKELPRPFCWQLLASYHPQRPEYPADFAVWGVKTRWQGRFKTALQLLYDSCIMTASTTDTASRLKTLNA